MKEPWFWRETGLAAGAAAATLAPAAFLYDLGQRLVAALTRPVRAGAPVICVGNATLGGVGKTPFALMLHKLLKAQGVDAHFLSRGYGGALKGPARVIAQHTSEDVGDEPLLLAAAAPTIIARDRAAGARAAGDGADAIIMDDGFQNRAVAKAVSLLLIDAADPAGNGKLFPAGPLREPLARAAARADAIILVGDGAAADETPGGLGPAPVFRASRRTTASIPPQRVFAFCGVGRPAQFFGALEEQGFTLAGRAAFPDHHPYTDIEMAALRARARKAEAALIATEKDIVRLDEARRDGVAVARLEMSVDDPEALIALVRAGMARAA
jgi:tetraacyldisaccharide 4'-kinase